MENIFAHNNHSFQKLSYLLKNLRRNTIIWISTESPEQQKKILSDIKTEFSNSLNQHTFSLLDYKDGSVYHFIKNAFPTETINSKDKPTAIHLLFADSLIIPKENDITDIKNTTPFVDNLNYERDVLYHKLPYTLIFWTAPTALQIIRRSALDFADWLTYTFEFKEEKEPTVNHHFIPTKTETIVEKISLDAAKNMFAAYNPIPYPSEKVESLLKNIHCYPILIEICAKQLYVNETINIDTLINAAIQSNFSLLNDNPITLSDDAYTETALDTFITQIFAPQSLSLEEQQCLMYFSLLKNIPYPLTKLQQWFEDKDNHLSIENIPDILSKLNQKGWIQATQIVENNENIVYYQCNLIVSHVIRKLLVPTTDNCIAFLENIKEEGHYHKIEHIIDRIQYLPELLQIVAIFPKENKIIAAILVSIGNFYIVLGDYSQALAYNLQALNILEKIFGKKHLSTATIYNNIGKVYSAMGDYLQALDYYQKAFIIFEKVFEKEDTSIATNHYIYAWLYYNLQDFEKALEYIQKAITTIEKKLPETHPYHTDWVETRERIKEKIKENEKK